LSTPAPPRPDLHLIVGYDGAPPASRALDAAVALLQGRTGRIDLVYVAHMPTTVTMSAGAVADMQSALDEIEQSLRAAAQQRLGGGSSSQATHRLVGSVAVHLARHSPVPLVVVP
jgi:nucleotide-binding universal stress UspA family protein